jgi:CRP-like cAMP-binding protein
MIEQLRRDIQQRIDQLLGEVDRLRKALTALGSHSSDSSSASGKAAVTKSRSRTATANPSRTRATATKAKSSSSTASRNRRAASGGTKSAVLAALAGGKAMTAGEVANATGLGRASVSTTLSKLAKSGEVTKAERGYRLPAAAPTA